MLIKSTVFEPRQIEKNIQLPFYSKNAKGDFFRVNEDESVLRVSLYTKFSYRMELNLKTEYTSAFALEEAISAKPCSAEEVEEAVRQYLEFMGATVEMLCETD